MPTTEERRRARGDRLGKLGCLIAVAMVALLALAFAFSDGTPSPDAEAPMDSAIPLSRSVDTSLLPIVNVDLHANVARPSAGLFTPVGEHMLAIGRELGTNPKLAEATAVNFMVRGPDDLPWMHLTVDVDPIRDAARTEKLPGYALHLGRETGFNTIDAERAAREYCGSATVGFCEVVAALYR